MLRAAVAPPTVDRGTALTVMERLGAVNHLVASLEYLVTPDDRRPGGLNDWQVARGQFALWPRSARAALDVVGRPAVTRALHGARVAAAGALLLPLPLPRRGRLAADLVLTAASLALYPRNHYGTDGADQAAFLVQTAAAVGRAAEDRPRTVDACLWFAGMQSVLSYTASGWVKASSETWRSGRALPGILRTVSYGEERAWRLVRDHPRAAKAVCTCVVALESSFPAVHLARGRAARPMVAAAAGFHLANAGVMGLGRFLTGFCSLHPAVLYITGPRERVLADGRVQRRDDTFPVAAGAALAAALTAGALVRARDRRTVLRGRGDERRFTTAAGTTLVHRRIDPPGGRPAPDTPVVVVSGALAESPERAEWLVRELAERHTVVTYHRAGQAGSAAVRGPRPGTGLDGAAADLADLVRHAAAGRPAVLVGHGLGGHIAASAATRLDGHLAGLVLVDPHHPDDTPRQDPDGEDGHTGGGGGGDMGGDTGGGAGGGGDSGRDPENREVTALLDQMAVSLRLGLGQLLRDPDWLRLLPEDVRGLARAHYRDAAGWNAARQEWRALRAAQRRTGTAAVPAAAVPTCLILCEPGGPPPDARRALQEEYVRRAPHAVVHAVDAPREQVLAARASARAVAELVAGFAAASAPRGRAADVPA